MTADEFKQLAHSGYNRVALTLDCPADLDTPLSLYLKLAANQANTFLLESVIGGERFGRYSFIGLPSRRYIRVNGWRSDVVQNDEVVETVEGNPLDFLSRYQQRFKVYADNSLPRFCGGLVGYFGYDTVRYIEARLQDFNKEDEIGTPDILLLQCETLAVVDNLKANTTLITYADPGEKGAWVMAQEKLQQLAVDLREGLQQPGREPITQTRAAQREFDRSEYLAAVRRAQQYIRDGDMMQVQIGQRIKKPYSASPLTLYRSLRALNPSPYMYYYNFGDFQVVGASPEILVREELCAAGQRVTIRPLAGTRPRGATPEEDNKLADELLADEKEIAEHVMLIDLARNDIGRIAQSGSVHVSEQFAIELYSHVMHIVSNVEGLMQPGFNSLDVLCATFPAGTLTGAPKVRAMEIIDELEPVKRGIYGGACGYLSYSGEMDLAIAIRTGVVKEGMLYVQAAAGIVADSVPENEWQETENKARALLHAAELAERGM